ncbi:MAG TPA: PAS domain S-box protein [Anaerolineae bacterium]|nr:PAS domain S-box protein [Anaerolineae bacterium]
MTNRSERVVDRFAAWTRSPRGGALIAAVLTLIILLPLWALALSWYQTAILSAELGQHSLYVFATGGLIVLSLLAGLIYLLVNRQVLLAQAVQQRTQDITRINEQLEGEIARLQEAEQSLHRWAHIFEHAEWGVAIGSANGRSLEMMNPAYARMHGYTVEELSGLPIDSVFAPGTAGELSALIRAANETGHAVMESKHIHRDGRVFPVLVDLTAVKDENGQVLYRVANVQDISERKQVEESLREREEQYRSIFEASLDGLFINSLDGRIIDVNPAGARMHGYTVEECRGLRSAQLVHPEQMEGLREFIEAARSGEQFRNDGIDVRKDGSPFPIEVVGTQFLYRGEPHALALVRDITERVQVEQALREREQQYRSVFESSLDGLFINDLEGRLVDFNPAAAHMHGYTVEEFRQVQPTQFVHPDSQPLFAAFMEAIQAGGEYRCRAVDVRKDGSLLHVEVVGAPFTLRGQLHAFAIVRDISAQVQAESQKEAALAALREREEQYRSVFESNLDGLAINDAQGRLVDFNPAMAHMHGYTVEEFRQVQPGQFIHPDSLPLFAAFMEEALAGREYRCRALDVRKDGSLFHIEVIGTPFTLRGQPHAFAIVHDISAQVEAEQALREREEQYRSIFESVSDGLFIDTIDGQMVDYNPAVAHMHGYTMEEFRQIPTIQIIHPDSLHLFQDFVETVQAGGQYRCRAVDVRKDGSLFPVEVTGIPFLYRGQRHLLAVLHDITTQVEAEQLLERRVAERTRELSTLLDISRNMASTLETEPLLGLILDALKVFVDYTSARINTLEGQVLRVRAARGLTRRDRQTGMEFALKGPVAEEVLIHRRVLAIPDISSRDDPWAVTFRAEGSANVESILAHVRSWMGVPLVAKGRVIGNLSLEHEQPGFYDAHQAEVVLALADQVAVALENARLFTEAQGKAVLEERQRLARDLHDSVTQSIYSLTLLAEAGRRLMEVHDVQQAARYLGDIGEIAQQSLKEMRLLVYQLRPLALEHEGLIGALQARLDSVEKRAGIEARFLIEGGLGNLSPAAEEGLFRIAQEALNNALKHAAARSVVVRLRGEDERVTLEVIDDGRGSALLTTEIKGGLGLTSMKERVTQLHGTVSIASALGQGTRVTIEVPRLIPAAS